jgi:F-type H+-transporting ATPase subunit b
MPQIEQLAATYSSQIFWLLLFFGFVFFAVGKGMVPKVLATVEARDDQIAADLATAEAARREADEAEEAWRIQANQRRAEAQAVIAEAKKKAATASEARLAEANKFFEGRLATAEARIGDARKAAAGEIDNVAAEAARDIVRRLAGLNVDEAAARAAVQGARAHG